MWCEVDQEHWSGRLPESGFWISNFGYYIVYIQDYCTVQRAHCTMVCSSFPRGLPWFRVLPSWIASYLLPPASCLLDCLGFAFCPLAVSYKPGSTVNRHSDKSLFLLTLHKSENEKRKQRGRMLKLSSAKLVCCVQSWNTRLSCFLELWEIASPIVCIS